MTRLGIWHIQQGQPEPLQAAPVDLEQDLESWIEHDPSLVEPGLTIVGRQIMLEDCRLDLLALDPAGRWVIIEIKRGELRRETLAQAIDYSSLIAAQQADLLMTQGDAYLRQRGSPRNVRQLLEEAGALEAFLAGSRSHRMILVGCGHSQGLTRMVDFLSSNYAVPISFVTFETFASLSGERFMVRDISNDATEQSDTGDRSALTLSQLLVQADGYGMGDAVRRLVTAGQQAGLYARPYRQSIMMTPPQHRNRMIYTVWIKPVRDMLNMWISHQAIAEFLQVPTSRSFQYLGADGRRNLTEAEAVKLAEGIETVLVPDHANDAID